MVLCAACASINLQALTNTVVSPPEWLLTAKSGPALGIEGMMHLKQAYLLKQSTSQCDMCALIGEAAVQITADIQAGNAIIDEEAELDRSSEPIYLCPRRDYLGRTFPDSAAEGQFITGLIAYVPIETGILAGAIRLYAEPGSQPVVRGDIIGRPPLSHSDSAEAHRLIKRWLEACLAQHDKCRCTLSGAQLDEAVPPVLPSRIIDIAASGDFRSVCLVETKGMRGYYTALSHCWGERSKHPLATTTSNYAAHLSGIPWDSLPKTFQDAIITTQAIGLRFLWIDSLCIVQDDHEDWLSESGKMGSVYEKARLTIAASHAHDSSEGLFFARGDPPKEVKLPSFMSDGNTPAYAALYPTNYEDIFPERGPLNERAWATQEWLLSRRMVFFTRGCLVWSCKAITQKETGEKCYNTAQNSKWKIVIEHYSERKLSNPTDRLMALEGLRTELQKKSGDQYLLGIWKTCLPDQLLWQVCKVKQPFNPLNLPSWSWASVPSGVRFMIIKKAKNLCSSIQTDGLRELIITSRFKPLPAIVEECHSVFSNQLGGDGPLAYDCETIKSMIRRDIDTSNVKLMESTVSLIYDVEQKLLGWTVLDSNNLPFGNSPLFCLSVMGTLTRKMDEALQFSNPGYPSKVPEYWVLVLQRLPLDHRYIRVGVGKIFNNEWWRGAPVQQIRIV